MAFNGGMPLPSHKAVYIWSDRDTARWEWGKVKEFKGTTTNGKRYKVELEAVGEIPIVVGVDDMRYEATH